MHPHTFGYLFRLRPLRIALKHRLAGKFQERLWKVTPGDIADYCQTLEPGIVPVVSEWFTLFSCREAGSGPSKPTSALPQRSSLRLGRMSPKCRATPRERSRCRSQWRPGDDPDAVARLRQCSDLDLLGVVHVVDDLNLFSRLEVVVPLDRPTTSAPSAVR